MNILWENIIYKNDYNKMECFKYVFKKKFVVKKKKKGNVYVFLFFKLVLYKEIVKNLLLFLSYKI